MIRTFTLFAGRNTWLRRAQNLLAIAAFMPFMNIQGQVNFTLSPTGCEGETFPLTMTTGTGAAMMYSWAAIPAGPVFGSTSSATTTVKFTTAGTYTIAGGALFGSGYGYTTQVITISPSPTISLSQSAGTTCVSNNQPVFSLPVTFTAGGATNYAWFPYVQPPGTPQPPNLYTVRPSSTTCYTVIGSAGNCSSTAVSCITVIPQFTLQAAANPSLICIGDTVALRVVQVGAGASGPPASFTYSWTESANAVLSLNHYLRSDVKGAPRNNTTYTVEMLDAGKCVSVPFAQQVSVTDCTSIGEDLAEKVSYFPQPATDVLYAKKLTPFVSVRLYALSGSVMFEGSADADGDLTIDVSALSSGLYMLRSQSGNCMKVLVDH